MQPLIAARVWVLAQSGMQARGSSGVSMIEFYEQQVAQTRGLNGLLERLPCRWEQRGK